MDVDIPTNMNARKRTLSQGSSDDTSEHTPLGLSNVPLKHIHLSMSKEKHQELDEHVLAKNYLRALKSLGDEMNDVETLWLLLMTIIELGKKDCPLNMKYCGRQEAMELIESTPFLADALKEAWKMGSFARIRSLGEWVLRQPATLSSYNFSVSRL